MKNYYIILLTFLFFTIHVSAQITGCTDPLSTNYNPDATVNDGSCVYASVTESHQYNVELSDEIPETSALITWGEYIYTHNDNDDVNLYALDTITGVIEETYIIPDVVNVDWEDVAQDDENLYIGDFGNNANGNRTDLKIIKINKDDLLNNEVEPEVINFSYADQTDFAAAGANNTNYDCEAIIATTDNLYLFTKQWQSMQTTVYSLPKTGGTYVAELKATYNVNGLITGATYLEDKNLVVLCGYDSSFLPFFYLLYDYEENNFFSGNKRKIKVSASFHQVEGISTTNGTHYFLSNEVLQHPTLGTIKQKLSYYDLSAYLEDYLNQPVAEAELFYDEGIKIYPNPADNELIISLNTPVDIDYVIINMMGQEVKKGSFKGETLTIPVDNLPTGIYVFKTINNKNSMPITFIKK